MGYTRPISSDPARTPFTKSENGPPEGASPWLMGYRPITFCCKFHGIVWGRSYCNVATLAYSGVHKVSKDAEK